MKMFNNDLKDIYNYIAILQSIYVGLNLNESFCEVIANSQRNQIENRFYECITLFDKIINAFIDNIYIDNVFSFFYAGERMEVPYSINELRGLKIEYVLLPDNSATPQGANLSKY